MRTWLAVSASHVLSRVVTSNGPKPTDLVLRFSGTAGQELSLHFEGYEITSSKLRKDQSPVLILYWRAMGRIERDYAVFIHLVDSRGEMIVGDDSMPRARIERTSLWRTDQFTGDAHILSISPEIAVGHDYRVEVGLYFLPTMEHLSIGDDRGLALTDEIVIQPFEVAE